MSNTVSLNVTNTVYCNKSIQSLIPTNFQFYKIERLMNTITLTFSIEKYFGFNKVYSNGTLYCPELTNIKSRYNTINKKNHIIQGKPIIKLTLCNEAYIA
jgi:hypothetical protein